MTLKPGGVLGTGRRHENLETQRRGPVDLGLTSLTRRCCLDGAVTAEDLGRWKDAENWNQLLFMVQRPK